MISIDVRVPSPPPLLWLTLTLTLRLTLTLTLTLSLTVILTLALALALALRLTLSPILTLLLSSVPHLYRHLPGVAAATPMEATTPAYARGGHTTPAPRQQQQQQQRPPSSIHESLDTGAEAESETDAAEGRRIGAHLFATPGLTPIHPAQQTPDHRNDPVAGGVDGVGGNRREMGVIPSPSTIMSMFPGSPHLAAAFAASAERGAAAAAAATASGRDMDTSGSPSMFLSGLLQRSPDTAAYADAASSAEADPMARLSAIMAAGVRRGYAMGASSGAGVTAACLEEEGRGSMYLHSTRMAAAGLGTSGLGETGGDGGGGAAGEAGVGGRASRARGGIGGRRVGGRLSFSSATGTDDGESGGEGGEGGGDGRLEVEERVSKRAVRGHAGRFVVLFGVYVCVLKRFLYGSG